MPDHIKVVSNASLADRLIYMLERPKLVTKLLIGLILKSIGIHCVKRQAMAGCEISDGFDVGRNIPGNVQRYGST